VPRIAGDAMPIVNVVARRTCSYYTNENFPVGDPVTWCVAVVLDNLSSSDIVLQCHTQRRWSGCQSL